MSHVGFSQRCGWGGFFHRHYYQYLSIYDHLRQNAWGGRTFGGQNHIWKALVNSIPECPLCWQGNPVKSCVLKLRSIWGSVILGWLGLSLCVLRDSEAQRQCRRDSQSHQTSTFIHNLRANPYCSRDSLDWTHYDVDQDWGTPTMGISQMLHKWCAQKYAKV